MDVSPLTSPLTSPATIATVLLDLDGVIRWFDKSRVPMLEKKHGLEPGSLRGTAFAPELIELATTGKITRAEWTRRVGEAVGSPEAAQAWLGHRGNVDHEIIEIVRALRSRGIAVAVLTNGTETVHEELAELGIGQEFDAVFTTADIGFAKPDPRAFRHVCEVLAVSPETVFFTDDTESKLSGAIELGMTAQHYTGVDVLRRTLSELHLLQA